MVQEAEYLIGRSASVNFEQFRNDEDLKRAFVRSLEIIGEATRRLDMEFRVQHSQVEWREIAGARDKLIHGYEGVDYSLVWDMVRVDVPVLLEQIRIILDEL